MIEAALDSSDDDVTDDDPLMLPGSSAFSRTGRFGPRGGTTGDTGRAFPLGAVDEEAELSTGAGVTVFDPPVAD